jgi:serine/threonine-protein kinase
MAQEVASLGVALHGRYAIERELGRGGMATVYLARDLRHDRMVALKILQPELGGSHGTERFQREIRLAARLSHPNILPLFDSGDAAGRFWYAMPYVKGESLRERLRREAQLEVPEAVRIAVHVAAGLSHAHSHGIVHRDIKPENILLAGEEVLVSDFGIAKALDASSGDKLTETGLSLGTPAYMSPEQASGSAVGARSDIYALGCMTYEMLAGTPPFTGPTAQAVMARHAVDHVPPLRTVRAAIPKAVEQAVMRALQKVPADRFATADEFGRALCGEALPWVSIRHWPSRARRGGLLGALMVIAAVGAVLLRPSQAAIPPSAAMIAVLPFGSPVGDTALVRLGQDLASTISASLDGVGNIRATDRLSIAAQFRPGDAGSLDRAAALARRLGAGSVLRGTLVQAGDKVRLDAGLYSTDGLAPLAQGIAITGHRDSMAALTDSVVWSLLSQIWQRGEPPSPSLGAVTTRSLPALRAFLDGERHFEQGDMGAAALAYRSAIAADSGFVVAHYRYALALSWFPDVEVEPQVIEALRRGAHGLPERDRLMARAFVADSLDLEVELLREVTRKFPVYWPGWFVFGDLFIHRAPMGGYDWNEGLIALRRAVELDPRLRVGWEHIFSYGNARRQPLADSALERMKELGDTGGVYEHLIQGLGRSGGVIGPELDRLADSVVRWHAADPVEYGKRYGPFAHGFMQFPGAQIELNRRRLELGVTDPERRINLQVGMAWASAARGGWDSAMTAMAKLAEINPGTYVPRRFAEFGDPVLAVESYGLAVLGTWLGATPTAAPEKRRPAALAAIRRLPEGITRSVAWARVAWFDGLLSYSRRDRSGILAARATAARSDYVQKDAVEASLAMVDRALSGDRVGAVRDLTQLERRCREGEECLSTPEIAVHRLLAARWLEDDGEIEGAVRLLRWYDASPAVHRGTFYIVRQVLAGPTYLARARLEEARGERRLAAEYYGYFLRVYDQPMPSQTHLITEAKEALARLAEGS